jgi:tetratricopeptide (TPR) repeat protein
VAAVLERREPDAYAEIAAHYDRGGDAASAFRYALLAAAAATAVYAHHEAAEVLRVAERNASSPAELAEVRVRLAEAAEALGHYDEAEELCDLAIDWFAGHGDVRRALPLRRRRERLRGLLGQPARQTLEACRALDAEAQALGADAERVALLTMISQTHGRLGDRAAAERVARDCVALAERVGEAVLIADSVNRLGVTIEGSSLEDAAECYRRALALYETAGDARGQANCFNNLGILQSHRGEWDEARASLQRALTLGRRAGTPDLRGLFSLNLGVVQLRCGDYDRARELFGEALALFAEVKHSELQLYALYNLAHLDREREEFASAEELYEVAGSLARRIGQADVEAGALAGAGLARLRLGRVDKARRAAQEVEAHVSRRAEWFQGRELIEALAVHVAGEAGDLAGAAARFDQARELAEGKDLYSALWLTAECAPLLRAHDADRVRAVVDRYAERVARLGSVEMRVRYERLRRDGHGARGELPAS